MWTEKFPERRNDERSVADFEIFGEKNKWLQKHEIQIQGVETNQK